MAAMISSDTVALLLENLTTNVAIRCVGAAPSLTSQSPPDTWGEARLPKHRRSPQSADCELLATVEDVLDKGPFLEKVMA